jgi:RNA polymerase sigma-70 factor (ECF subfamily)
VLEMFRQSGNNQYLGILLQRYTLLLFGVCMKYLRNEEEAKDAVQQVFIKALGEAGKYPITYFKSWIYTVARNYCLMELRKNHRTISDEEVQGGLADTGPDPLEEKLQRDHKEQLLSWIEQGLQQLQEPQRQCVTLFYLEKCSYQQIAERTGHSLMQVKSAIQNGKRNIKIWVEKQRQIHAS